jgi:hypothetical protein
VSVPTVISIERGAATASMAGLRCGAPVLRVPGVAARPHGARVRPRGTAHRACWYPAKAGASVMSKVWSSTKGTMHER